MRPAALDLGVLDAAEFIDKRAALRLDHEIQPFAVIGIDQNRPIRVVAPSGVGTVNQPGSLA